jgi:hypothetical protein
MSRLEVFDLDDRGILRFDLAEILTSMPREVRDLLWCFKQIEATGEDILLFEAKVSSQTDGLCLPWGELLAISEKFEQVIDMTLVARSVAANNHELIRLEVIDSSLWAVETQIASVLSWVQESFVKVVVA